MVPAVLFLPAAFVAVQAPSDPVPALRAFLQRRPDHLEARRDLFLALAEQAALGTQRRLGLPPPAPRLFNKDALDLYAGLETLSAKRLTDEEDARLWGPAVQELERLFREDWELVLPSFATSPRVPAVECCSPRMLAAYRRHLPKVEEALRRRPIDHGLWNLWVRMGPLLDKRVLDLYRSLDTPAPADGGFPWPVTLWDFLIRDMLKAGDWKALADFKRAVWPMWQAQLDGDAPKGVTQPSFAFMPDALDMYWSHTLEPFLEALLRIGALGEAQELVQELTDRPLLASKRGPAAVLAARCGYPDLATRWVSLAATPVVKALWSPFDSLEDLAQYEARWGQHAVVTVEGREARLASSLNALIAQDPLAELGLVVYRVSPESAFGQLLQKESGGTGTPAWFLLDAKGKRLGSGTDAPRAEGLQKAFTQAGLPSYLDVLRGYAKAHPDNLPAQFKLLSVLKRHAERRTEQAMGVSSLPPGAPWYPGGGSIQPGDGTAVPPERQELRLKDAEDAVLWEEYATVLERALPEFVKAPIERAAFWASAAFVHSPRMRALARRWIGEVETRLQKAPHSASHWDLWFALVAPAGDRSMRQLLSSLEPLPGTKGWPPHHLLTRYLEACRSEGAWASIRELAEDALQGCLARGGRACTQETWDRYGDPLLEAHLQLGETGKAEGLLRSWLEADGWRGAAASAAGVARRLKLEALAKAWEARTPAR